MSLSTSAIMANHLAKTQLNNYMNYSPSKSQYSASGDYSGRPQSQYVPGSQRYSPELESLRRELNDQMRSYFYSLTSDVNALKKDNTDNKTQMDELRREIETTNSKLSQLKSGNPELKESYSKENKSGSNWMRNERKLEDPIGNVGEINDRIYQISRQIHTINAEMETLKKPNYVSKEQFTRNLSDIIDELERKLQIINERVRERIEEMDISLVRSQNEKEKEYSRLYYDVKNMQTSITKLADQVNNFAQDTEIHLESHVKKMMNSYSGELKNLSTTASSTDTKFKGRTDTPLLNASAYPYQGKEIDVKLRELDSVSQTIALLEKEMRSKIDMIDLNINSVKRNLELELSIQLKQMVIPIQNNLDQYLQSTEGRFAALEDAVLNHMKRDSYIMAAERATRLRGSGTLDLRGSNFDENIQFANKTAFNNISVIDSNVEPRQEKQSNSRLGSGMKERGREKERYGNDTFKIDEVDSVLSMNETLHSALKGDGRHSRGEEQRPSFSHHNEPKRETVEDEEEEEEEEAPAINTAKQILSDKDRNKKQKTSESYFKSLEPVEQPESLFRDFPSTSAMKSALEMEHPDNRVQERSSSAKKKKPEIDVTESHKNSLRDAPKKQGNQVTSPFGSKLALATNAFINEEDEEEQAPPIRKNAKDNTKNNTSAGKGKQQVESVMDEPEEEFSGNIKGLLRKSRDKRANQFQEEEEEQPVNKGKNQQKGKFEEPQPQGKFGKEQAADPFKKGAPLPKKNFEKQIEKDKQKMADLPPVDTKAMKNFNKGAGNQPPGGKGGYNQGRNNPNMGYSRGFDSGDAWRMQNAIDEEEEDVEEIVYNVDEEGFLVDEQGNYLVDEQGNFLQLSAEQMREIEDKDLVYEKEDY